MPKQYLLFSHDLEQQSHSIHAEFIEEMYNQLKEFNKTYLLAQEHLIELIQLSQSIENICAIFYSKAWIDYSHYGLYSECPFLIDSEHVINNIRKFIMLEQQIINIFSCVSFSEKPGGIPLYTLYND